MSTGIFVVLLLIVAGGWWIPLVIWGRRRAKYWHRYDVEHGAALLEEKLREHDRRAARLGPRPTVARGTPEEVAYLRAYERIFEDCPCPYCVSMWLMCKAADSPNPRHRELAKHMAKHVGVLLAGVGLTLGGCTLGHRGWLPNTPVNGQTAAQVQRDKDECTEIAKGALPPFGERLAHAVVPFANYGYDPGAALEQAYRDCMTTRGYKAKS